MKQSLATIDIDERLLLRVAREIAADIWPLEDILERLHIDQATWHKIEKNHRFQTLVESEIQAWNAAGNTHERVRVKAAAGIEDWLVHGFTLLNDTNEPWNTPKVELLKTLGRFANIGVTGVGAEVPGNALRITINLGEDKKLTFEKELPPTVIEAEPISD